MRDDLSISKPAADDRALYVAIGIIAWNEERGIAATLQSLFQQSIFQRLQERGLKCGVWCVANGCTDRTAEVAAGIFEAQLWRHPHREAFTAQVAELRTRGKVNAWNEFVHRISSPEARFLILLDADILIHLPDTLWNLVTALEQNPEAMVAVDQPRKDLLLKKRKSIRDWLSLAASRLQSVARAQLCAQLYCIRAATARKIYLPKDLAACDDGFIKTLVCTDLLTAPSMDGRICAPEGAAHVFEAYRSPLALLRNQKRQIIGQTIVHVLVDHYLKNRPLDERLRLAETLRERDRLDPEWLQRLIREHLARTRFWWRLYPGLLGLRFRRLREFSPAKRALLFPAAALGAGLAFVSGFLARRSLEAGCHAYWPRAKRSGLSAAAIAVARTADSTDS